jgi:hypothetical protein
MADALRRQWWVVGFRRLILLDIAKLAVAVAANDRSKTIVGAPRDMMRFEASPISFAANRAAWIV